MKKLTALFLTLFLLFALNIGFADDNAQPAIAFDLSKLVTREAILVESEDVTSDETATEAESSEEVTDEEAETIVEVVIFKGKGAKLPFELTGAEDLKKTGTTWTSSDPSIVSVSSGNLTVKQAGTVTITCTVEFSDGTSVSNSVQVTAEIAVTSLSVAKNNISVHEGASTEAIEVKFSPADATCQDLIWTSEDESIATVDENGVITGVAAGKTKITATSAEETDKPKTVTLTVTVTKPVSSITLDQPEIIIAKNKSVKLAATVGPEDATSSKLTWTSSDTSVATVSANGQLSAKAPGTATITATAADGSGVTAECTVIVYAPATGVSLSSSKADVFMETEGTQLTATLKPEDAGYYEITWSSSDETVATVDEQGNVTPVKGGKATITVSVTDTQNPSASPKTATCTVSVVQGVKDISIDGSSTLRLAKGASEKLTATVTPDDATNPKVTWTSSDSKVVSVNTTGQISAKAPGTATITCTAADGSGASDTITVTVYQGVTSVSPDKSKATVTEGKTVTLVAKVGPENAADKSLTWTSSDSSIATVDSTGKVTGVSYGRATITATSVDNPSKSTSFNVTVEPRIAVDATKFTRSGYFGAYYEFAVTFKNQTKTRTINYIEFDLDYTYNGTTYSLTSCYSDDTTIGPGSSKQIGWWDNIGYRLSYCSDFRVYLKAVGYTDGSYDFFYTDRQLLGWFN